MTGEKESSSPSQWRYRLGVRMDGSQPFDRGSNPRSATKSSLPSRSLLVFRKPKQFLEPKGIRSRPERIQRMENERSE